MSPFENQGIDCSRYTILLVDDIAVNLLLIDKVLSMYGFRILKASNGQMALDEFEASRPDLILLDLMMPGMDGFEVLQHLRSSDSGKDVPVIIASALNSEADIKKCLSLGANDFVSKPIIREQLVNSVMNQIRRLTNTTDQSAAATVSQTPTADISNILAAADSLAAFIYSSPTTLAAEAVRTLRAAFPPEFVADDDLITMLIRAQKGGWNRAALTDSVTMWLTRKISASAGTQCAIDPAALFADTVKIFSQAMNMRSIETRMIQANLPDIKQTPLTVMAAMRCMLACVCATCHDTAVELSMEADAAGRITISATCPGCDRVADEATIALAIGKEAAVASGGQLRAGLAGDDSLMIQLSIASGL